MVRVLLSKETFLVIILKLQHSLRKSDSKIFADEGVIGSYGTEEAFTNYLMFAGSQDSPIIDQSAACSQQKSSLLAVTESKNALVAPVRGSKQKSCCLIHTPTITSICLSIDKHYNIFSLIPTRLIKHINVQTNSNTQGNS